MIIDNSKRLVFNDTVRLGDLLDERVYAKYLKERDLTREQHLGELCSTLLSNLNVLLDQGYTLTWDGNLPSNLKPSFGNLNALVTHFPIHSVNIMSGNDTISTLFLSVVSIVLLLSLHFRAV